MTEQASQFDDLLSFLYQMPYGVVSSNADGVVSLMNANATSILMPFAASADLSNLFSVLETVDPTLSERTRSFDKDSGTIFKDERHHVRLNENTEIWLDLTLIKLSAEQIMLGLIDRTELVLIEKKAREEEARQADSAARLEMATSVIHDIGNAISAVGVNSASLVATNNWQEIGNIERVQNLLGQHEQALDGVLGAGKGAALTGFLTSIKNALMERQSGFADTAKAIAKNLHHVQDIIRIQKQFAKDGAGAALLPVDLIEVIHHSESMLSNLFTSQGINFKIERPDNIANVSGDKTRLTQVFMNTLKNACEAIIAKKSSMKDDFQGSVTVLFDQPDQDNVAISVTDNGIGFDRETEEKITQGQFTSKSEGSGIGLNAIKAVIESHQGLFSIASEGVNKGCTVSIQLPTHQASQA